MISATTERRLDEFEETLPALPAALFRTNRVVTRHVVDTASSVVRTLSRSIGRAGDATRASVTTAGEQVKANADQAISAVENAATTSATQVKRQAKKAASKIVDEVETVADKTERALEDQPTGAYETWTKAELYDRAQELEIDGRSTMNKKQLIATLRA